MSLEPDRWPFPPIEFPIAGERTALLVVDMQLHNAHPDYGVGAAVHAADPTFGHYFYQRVTSLVVPSIQRLLAAFRRHGWRRVHITLGAELDDLGDLPPTARRRSRQRWDATGHHTLYARGTPEFEILPQLAPKPGELVVNKTTLGAFNSTVLDQTLRNLGVDTVLLAGVVTSVCVETTARDAVDRGFSTVIVDDACAAWDQASHDATVRAFRRYFGRVLDTERVLAELEQTRRPGKERGA